MADAAGLNREMPPPAGKSRPHGCVALVIEESAAMNARVAGGTKSKIDSVATALNSLLGQLAALPAIDLALVGYRTNADGEPDVGSRWAGPLRGCELVASDQLAAAPLAVEDRVRKIPAADGIAVDREETVRFPVWYLPEKGTGPISRDQPKVGARPEGASHKLDLSPFRGTQIAAYEHCRRLLAAWLPPEAGQTPNPPLVVSFVEEIPDPHELAAAAAALAELDTAGGRPLVFHAHLASSARVPATLYPAGDAHLVGPVRELFRASSELPPALAAELKSLRASVNDGARGLIYNAKLADLIRFLSLVKAYARQSPAAAKPAAAPPVEEVTATLAAEATTTRARASALVVLLLDRSVDPPQHASPKNVWARLQQEANRLLAELAAQAGAAIDVAVVSYGARASGRAEVRTSLAGAAAGRQVIGHAELAAAALRVDELIERVPNGIGGLLEINRRKPVFVESQPAFAGGAEDAIAAVAELTSSWQATRLGSPGLPIVLHLSRGCFQADELERAVSLLCKPALGQPLLYHLVLTESPHRSLAYPADPAAIGDSILRKLWEVSSPLLGRQELAAKRPAVSGQSRGFVVNGRFDLLLEGIRLALAGSETRTDSRAS